MRRPPPIAELGFVLALLLLAAFFRFFRIDSVPLGLAPDLAFNGLDARDVIAGHLPVFFPRNNGREALYLYFQTAILAGAGFRVLSFTFAGAAVGVLGVAASYRAWRALFGWRIGLLAAFLLAISFWDVASNRAGFRVNSMLPLMAISIFLLWKVLRTGRWRWAICGGAAMGLTLYTYTASRLIPILAAACCLCAWGYTRRRLPQLGVLALTAAIVCVPEGVYFVRHPQEFLLRAQAVASVNADQTSQAARVGTGASPLTTLRMLYVTGDRDPTWNLIGKPILAPWVTALFLAGILIALWRCRRSPAPRWALCWLVIMLLPATLSNDPTDSQRALGAAPVVFLFPALSLDLLLRALRLTPLGYAVMALAVVVPASYGAFSAYFLEWAHNADVYGGTDVSRLHLVQFLTGRNESRLYFADSDITSHVVRMFLPTTDQDGWQPESSAAIPLPSRLEGDTLYVSTTDGTLKDLAPLLPGVHEWPHPNNPLNKPDFYAFTWSRGDAEAFLGALTPANQTMGEEFTLEGYAFQRSAQGGLAASAVWRPIHPSGPYDMYVHLMDASGRLVGQSDRLVYPVRDFRNAHEGLGPVLRGYFDEGSETGDRLLTLHDISAPAGDYVAEIGLAKRDPTNPGAIIAGVGTLRVPVTVAAG